MLNLPCTTDEQSVATSAVQTVLPASLESSFHAPMNEDAQMPFDPIGSQTSPQRSMTTALGQDVVLHACLSLYVRACLLACLRTCLHDCLGGVF